MLCVLCTALMLAGSLPTSADWLVTGDGHRIKTDGPWKVKGRMVVYTDDRGTLSSLRLTEVDLEASEAAGKEQEEEAPPPSVPPAKKTSVLVLTNDDIPEGRETAPAAPPEPRPELVMYSTDWCGVCRRARNLLDGLGADYVEKDIEKGAEARREYVATFGGSAGVPAFAFDGESFVGLRPDVLEKWVAKMKAGE